MARVRLSDLWESHVGRPDLFILVSTTRSEVKTGEVFYIFYSGGPAISRMVACDF